MHIIKLIIFAGVLLESVTTSTAASCPESNNYRHRVGKSRYYIYHIPQNRSYHMNWKKAKKICSSEPNFRMARIEKLTTLASVGRQLENWVNDQKALDTWYWLDAKFNEVTEMYEWNGDHNLPLTYTNFFYRYPRPTGVGSHLNYKGTYLLKAKEEQCLTLALPYPGLATSLKYPGQTIFGHATTFDERPCKSSQTRRAMCESTLPECSPPANDPFIISEDMEDYFTEGNWIIGDRKYILSWKQMSHKDGKEYCRKLGLRLFNPTLNEQCVIPHVKLWSRGLTISQFWTTWTYEIEGEIGKFYDQKRVQMAERTAFVFTNGTEFADGRSNKLDKKFCVAMQISYEFRKSQMPCPDPEKGIESCYWNFIQYVPTNCNNMQGVICEHADSWNRKCTWQSSWIDKTHEFLSDPNEATVEFGYAGNSGVAMRSRYKQTFGSLVCKRHYQMARFNNTNWYMKPENDSTYQYKYDYLETYWVVDEEGFDKNINSKCKVSSPADETGFNRLIKTVSCVDWHYYLCVKVAQPSSKPKPVPYEIPKVSAWNTDRHPRIYPILYRP